MRDPLRSLGWTSATYRYPPSGPVGGIPAALDRVLAADEFDVGGLAGFVGGLGALQGGDTEEPAGA